VIDRPAVATRVAASAFALCVGACDSPPEPGPPPQPSTTASVELEPGALVEGPTSVLGLRVPVGAEVATEMTDYAVWTVQMRPEIVANYVRARVDGNAVVGARRTVFDGVTLKVPGDTSRLTIIVEPTTFGTRVMMKRR
jgi:hypothetical protein